MVAKSIQGRSGTNYEGNVTLGGETFVMVGNGTNPGSTLTLYGTASDSFSPPDSFSNNVVNNSPFEVCFAAGTLIATPEGESVVEELQIGDALRTAAGGTTTVKWVGRQTVHKIFTPAERFVPVRVTAGALGGGLPHTDLVLTADHALILDDLAINASALVNGTTIAYDPVESLPEQVTYYHVESEGHEVILANGAPVETYIDYVARRVFDNYREYLALYGEERTITEMDLPRVSAVRLLPPALRARLSGQRAA